jgi:hypothetical protein
LESVSYTLLTRPPLPRRVARLAYVRHAASVNPEPGSNSSKCVRLFSLRKKKDLAQKRKSKIVLREQKLDAKLLILVSFE